MAIARPENPNFVRSATGLVKELTWIDVFVWFIIFFPWLTSWSGLFWITPDYYQNVNYYLALGVWAITAIVVVVLYWQLTSTMPRSGGDYVFASRAIAPAVGFVASFILYVALLTDPASTGAYWGFSEAGLQLSLSGQILSAPWITNLGNFLNPATTSSPVTLFAASFLLLVIGAIGVMLGGRIFRMIIYGFFAYGAISLVAVMAMFSLNNQSTFASDYAKYFTGGVQAVLKAAAGSGYSPGYSLATLGLVVPVIFVSLGPYPTMQLVGGEIRNVRRSLLYGTVGAQLISIVIFVLMTYAFDHAVGISFLEAYTVTQNYSSTVPSALAMVFYPNQILLWIITVGLFVGNIGWWWLALVFASRIPMAWALDRVGPAGLAHVSDRFHTPTTAILLTVLLAMIPMYLVFFTSFISTQLNGAFLFTLVWLISAVAAVVLPFRRKSIFEGSQNTTRFAGFPVISWIGIVSIVVIGYLSYNALTNPAIGPSALSARLVILAIIAVSAATYAISYYYHRRKGLDLSTLSRELPPE
ncbi:MAG TPA: APC family permease [Nitrososphaerales archaeon]|nr:APC family permease [Nitrososphaerales archaeon]